jgi:maltose O-acetyltransferase
MIRRAQAREHEILSRISFAAKRYWKYPAHYYDIWQDELTITPAYIGSHEVYLHEEEDIAGFYSLTELHSPLSVGEIILEAGLWLEHMFILPQYIGRGIGRKLFHHCLAGCSSKEHRTLRILADPNAAGFYTKMGCSYIKDYPSTIPGRTTPYLEYLLKPHPNHK